MYSFIKPRIIVPIKRHAVLHPFYDYTIITSYQISKLNTTSPKMDILRACCSLLYKSIYFINPNIINIPAPVRYDLFDVPCKLKMKYYFICLFLSLVIHFTFNHYILTLIYIVNRIAVRSKRHFGIHFTGLILFYLYVLDIVYLIFF